MDDETPFASHVAKRGRVYQYVRRIPGDIADNFPFARVQRSLRTADKARAYEAAAGVHAEVEKQFAYAATLGLLWHVCAHNGHFFELLTFHGADISRVKTLACDRYFNLSARSRVAIAPS